MLPDSRADARLRGGRSIISNTKVISERRSAAPHPGPILKAEFFDPIGLTAAAFAAKVGMEPAMLAEMLAGTRSFDVPTAIRLARTLQVSAEKVMQMQLKYDFALARNMPELRSLQAFGPGSDEPFPESDFMSGHLGRADADGSADGSFYFQQRLERPVPGDQYAGLHALWRGDRLRIFAPGTRDVLWIGPVLQNLDGRLLLPYAQAAEWQAWFAAGNPADLALGEDHRAFFSRMDD